MEVKFTQMNPIVTNRFAPYRTPSYPQKPRWWRFFCSKNALFSCLLIVTYGITPLTEFVVLKKFREYILSNLKEAHLSAGRGFKVAANLR
jgi:hypothetical protein